MKVARARRWSLAVALTFVVACDGGGGGDGGESSGRHERWSGVGYLVREEGAVELCFGPPIGPEPSYVAGCPGLTVTNVALDAYDAYDVWSLPEMDVVVARFTGTLAQDRTSIAIDDIEELPHQRTELAYRTVVFDPGAFECAGSALVDYESLVGAGLTEMPVGVLEATDDLTFITAVGVDDAWAGDACRAGLRHPQELRDVLTPA